MQSSRLVVRRLALAAVFLTLLAGCTSLLPGGASKLRTLDYRQDDIASLLVAFDVPLTLEPQPNGSILSLDVVTPANGERHLRAVLGEADADDLAGTLPAPAEARTYYLFGFSDADKHALREIQAWAKTLPPGTDAVSIVLSPALCANAPVDPAATRISVLVALPGATSLAPLMSNQSLKDLLARNPGQTLPSCAGHSG